MLVIGGAISVHDYFTITLQLITDLFKQKLSVETFELLLRWSEEIVVESRPFLSTLILTQEFRLFLASLCRIGRYAFSDAIILKVCFCFELLISNSDIIFQVCVSSLPFPFLPFERYKWTVGYRNIFKFKICANRNILKFSFILVRFIQ